MEVQLEVLLEASVAHSEVSKVHMEARVVHMEEASFLEALEVIIPVVRQETSWVEALQDHLEDLEARLEVLEDHTGEDLLLGVITLMALLACLQQR